MQVLMTADPLVRKAWFYLCVAGHAGAGVPEEGADEDMDEDASNPEGSELAEAEQVARARAFAAALKSDKPGNLLSWMVEPQARALLSCPAALQYES